MTQLTGSDDAVFCGALDALAWVALAPFGFVLWLVILWLPIMFTLLVFHYVNFTVLSIELAAILFSRCYILSFLLAVFTC